MISSILIWTFGVPLLTVFALIRAGRGKEYDSTHVGLALGSAAILGFGGSVGWPDFPPREALHWLGLTTFITLLGGMAYDLYVSNRLTKIREGELPRPERRPGEKYAGVVMCTLLAITFVIVLRPLLFSIDTAGLKRLLMETWALDACLGAAIIASAQEVLRRNGLNNIGALSIGLCAAVAGVICLYSGSARLAQAFLALGVAYTAGSFLSWKTPDRGVGATWMGQVLLFGLLLCGHHYGDMPRSSCNILMVIPVITMFCVRPALKATLMRGSVAFVFITASLALSLASTDVEEAEEAEEASDYDY